MKIELRNIQHVKELLFDIDLSKNSITCITGKNGVGKTTLVKAIGNMVSADIFSRVSSLGIFGSESRITYKVGDVELIYAYDPQLRELNCRKSFPASIKSTIAVELPIPHGERFNFFGKVSKADDDIRRAVVLGNHSVPTELIEFLNNIYSTSKFNKLVEISLKSNSYFCILRGDSRYIREDHLSSGEYFLISLYRRIKRGYRLIVIDEIDISLDAAAQVKLIKVLRSLCGKYQVNFLFTTHSLPMMRTLERSELFYMEGTFDHEFCEAAQSTCIKNVSYNFIKSVLFGFSGWDRYILTEDEVVKDFLEYIIDLFCGNIFFKFNIIYVGGGSQIVSLLERNSVEHFFALSENVIAVLDGDQRGLQFAQRPDVYFALNESVEKDLYAAYKAGDVDIGVPEAQVTEVNALANPKNFFRYVQRNKIMSRRQILEFLCGRGGSEQIELVKSLKIFLSGS